MPDVSAVPNWKKVEALECCIKMLQKNGSDATSIKASLHACRADFKTVGPKSISFGDINRALRAVSAEEIARPKDDIVIRTHSGVYSLPGKESKRTASAE